MRYSMKGDNIHMLHCTVKFCGGCNPRHDRGECYGTVRSALSDAASFSLPEEGAHYDVLLVITSRDDMQSAIDEIRAAASHSAG